MTRRWSLRRREEPDDPVQIDEESEHGWWAQREQLDRPIDRRWRGAPPPNTPRRRAADRAASTSALPRDPWDPSSLFTSTPTGTASTPVDDGHDGGVPRSEPAPDAHAGGAVPPWSTLGLTSDASWDEVVQRHRHLAKQHHPDRHGVGDSEERRRAEDNMAAINAAFDDLGRIYTLTDDR